MPLNDIIGTNRPLYLNEIISKIVTKYELDKHMLVKLKRHLRPFPNRH